LKNGFIPADSGNWDQQREDKNHQPVKAAAEGRASHHFDSSVRKTLNFPLFFVNFMVFLVVTSSDVGIQDFEPRVINQLLEFTYRYVTTILDDAK
jgi:hypothetical protein